MLQFMRGTELKRFRASGALPKVAIAVLLIIPLIYGALYLWAFWAPTDNLDKLPVAIVNLDESAEKPDGEVLNAGADVTKELQEGKDLDWQVFSAADAQQAVADGDVYFSVTIPADFSSTIAGLQDDPQAGKIDVLYNDSNSFLATTLGKTAMVQVRDAVAESISQQAAEQVLVGVEKLSDGVRDAADASETLHEGSETLSEGAQTLATGVQTLASGSGELSQGLNSLSSGTGQLRSQLPTLKSGTSELNSGAKKLAASTPDLVDGADAVADGASELSEQLAPAAAGAPELLEKFTELNDGAAQLATGTGAIAQLAQAYPDMTLAQLDQTLQAQAGVGLADISAGAAEMSAGTSAALPSVKSLSAGLPKAAAGAEKLAAGSAKVADGAGKVDDAASKLATGTKSLNTAVTTLQSGVAALDDGAKSAASGGAQLADGAQTAATGSTKLAEGTSTLETGAGSFAEQLAEGAADAPTFTGDQTTRISETIATPVELSEQTENEVQGFGEGFAPFFIALATFVGALITWLILRPLPRRPLASKVSGFRSVLAGFAPAALIGLGQVVIMMLVLVYAIGMRPVHWLGMASFMLLVTLAFLALQQTFIALFGTAAGRVVSLVLLMLQLSSSGGTYPVETTPVFFQVLHPFMPATYVVTGLRQLIGGGIDARFWVSLAVMAGLLVASLLVSAIVARRQKVWTVERLHPSLAI